jgi:hypothetical protein
MGGGAYVLSKSTSHGVQPRRRRRSIKTLPWPVRRSVKTHPFPTATPVTIKAPPVGRTCRVQLRTSHRYPSPSRPAQALFSTNRGRPFSIQPSPRSVAEHRSHAASAHDRDCHQRCLTPFSPSTYLPKNAPQARPYRVALQCRGSC